MDKVSAMHGGSVHIREFHMPSPLRLNSKSFLAPLIQAAFLVGYLHLKPEPTQ